MGIVGYLIACGMKYKGFFGDFKRNKWKNIMQGDSQNKFCMKNETYIEIIMLGSKL